jgi:DNA-binding MarR family transcriptional regulator
MDETRWLDTAQQEDWRAFIDGAVRLLGVIDRDLKLRHGLSEPEYEILVRLSEAPEQRVRMAELADSANHSRSRLSHAVSRLEGRGLVRRASCPQDRRGVYAHLTDEGFDTLDRAARDHIDVVRDYFVDVVDPADLAAVGRAFRAVRDKIDAAGRAGGPPGAAAGAAPHTAAGTATGTAGDTRLHAAAGTAPHAAPRAATDTRPRPAPDRAR